ncbi:MAG: hypothetical protein K8F34_08580 [Candidatus Kuenenia stuttgartiensis]|jgi:hypothetical protein|uniref:Uncharacterized protein n=1 Tax=Kuenenia stuttgartiensis TaxID=174633 RepID=A0A2C9CDH4_KUEST|nr:hypothetical protein [Candidatus Kuenenia stuttgartiensis]MBE7547653.1 hypothetical protein [Planctomycetia bacterium]MBZ0191735.1 hypothetical protein [Candidatus Kuenenia stuttgartiensis]MCL4728541.1 hypothetical protein [Candidatus Kuenenia stuttgartiensis]SOH03633.1 hypothetical protein KSMBR1_1130 [Candidatus Kuenenia stuttgartiensis]GJQ48802.1 MAG: hypothetical protein HKUEN01_11880 [Candidatus Kuenenia stuttgartiensis]
MKVIDFLQVRYFKKKMLLLVIVLGMMTVLVQCASVSQRWPENERRTEDRMFLLQQEIGKGLGSGELTLDASQEFVVKLDNLRRDYTVLRERKTTQEEWAPLLTKLEDMEKEVKVVLAYPSRIDETKLEDRMIVLQRRLDDGMLIGRLRRVQGRDFQLRLDDIRREFLQRIKDRPLTTEEKGETSSRLDLLESDVNNAL